MGISNTKEREIEDWGLTGEQLFYIIGIDDKNI